MSADNGIYILETDGPEYRVAHLQAVENINWNESLGREDSSDDTAIDNASRMWKGSAVHTSRQTALMEADKMARDCPVLEYGISFIKIKRSFKEHSEPMDSYYVQFRDAANDRRLTQRYAAENFSHAEEQAKQDVEALGGQIVSIDLDYK